MLKYSGLIVFLSLWEVSSRLHWLDSQFLPPFSVVLIVLCKLLVNGSFFVHASVSLWRAFAGLLLAMLIGIPGGLMLGWRYPRAAQLLDPLTKLFGLVNPFSIMPVFILFLGIGEAAKLAVVAWVSVWPILHYTRTGAETIDATLVKTAKSTGISSRGMLVNVVMPSAAPGIFQGMRAGLEMSFFMLIVAEMVGANAGLGWMVHNSAMNYLIPRMYAAGAGIVGFGVLMKLILACLQERFFFWKEASMLDASLTTKRWSRKENKAYVVFIAGTLLIILLFGSWEAQRFKLIDSLDRDVGHHHHHSGE